MLAVLTYLAEEKEKSNPMPWKQYEHGFDYEEYKKNTTKSGSIKTIKTKPQNQPRNDDEDSLRSKKDDNDNDDRN